MYTNLTILTTVTIIGGSVQNIPQNPPLSIHAVCDPFPRAQAAPSVLSSSMGRPMRWGTDVFSQGEQRPEACLEANYSPVKPKDDCSLATPWLQVLERTESEAPRALQRDSWPIEIEIIYCLSHSVLKWSLTQQVTNTKYFSISFRISH